MISKINIGLNEQQRSGVAKALNMLLANEYFLYTKTLKYHWNLVSPHFGALHLFFEKQYEMLLAIADEVAERIPQLGHKAEATLNEFAKVTSIQEDPGQYPSDMEMIKRLLDGHELIIKQLRTYFDMTAQLNDAGTNNFFAETIEKHEKMAWMLRSHLV